MHVMPMCEKGSMWGFGGQTGNRLPTNRAQMMHIFADRPGHLPDTPRNRQIIVELINDRENRVGVDGNGKTWYAKTLPDGSQLWASVFGDVLSDAGKNEVPREWNDETGFNRNPFRRKRRN